VAGACESIPVILQAHPSNEYVASAGCDVISFMSETLGNGFAARFGQAGGCEAVVRCVAFADRILRPVFVVFQADFAVPLSTIFLFGLCPCTVFDLNLVFGFQCASQTRQQPACGDAC
jgi:hypothetical protein